MMTERIVSMVVSQLKSVQNPIALQNLQNEPDLEYTVTEIIHQVGIPAHIKGYQYIRDGIIMVVNNIEIINPSTRNIVKIFICSNAIKVFSYLNISFRV